MTASLTFLGVLVGLALAATAVTPVILLGLLIRDWKKRTLW